MKLPHGPFAYRAQPRSAADLSFHPWTIWNELASYVAAEANHAKVKKLEKALRQLYGRIADVLESYTDKPDASAL